ncbi:hypothetical protein K488DRAFT_92003 [Vararia minispora EC-137]|uniref:Uncharacterized protein n=1 Tax=Vararia minispora EC-137 TaxID=1314806 RepID=A0ACB8Q4P4_9AGAM|nr:hypothetical protein K488DRAFT_92003 [Vararia minispora EC-137]
MFVVPYAHSDYEPNQGVYPGMTPPPSLESRFPDLDCALPVYVVVSAHPSPDAPDPRPRPWALAWPLALANNLVPALLVAPPSASSPTPDFAPIAVPVPVPARSTRIAAVARVLQAARAPARDHFTFWGALTRAWTREDMHGARWVLLALLDRPHRRALEHLADNVRLMKPNGWWNGQNWVVALLNAAVEDGIVSYAQRDAALVAAASI